MSEITRKKFEKKVALKYGTLTIKGRPWTTPRELGKEAGFERQVEEARREEQRLKEELKMAKEDVERKVLRVIAEMIEDEIDAQAAYSHIAGMLAAIGLDVTARQIREFEVDERKHYDALNRLFSTIRGAPFKGRRI